MARARTVSKVFEGRRLAELGRVHVLREDEGATRRMGTALAAELEDEAAFAARFGGGRFLLLARDVDNKRIAARARVTLDAEPLDAGDLVPPGRGRRSDVARTHATSLGALQATVFRMLRAGATLEDIVDATHVPAQTLRDIYLEWLTDFGEERPQTPEEIAARAKVRRERRLHAWDRALGRNS